MSSAFVELLQKSNLDCLITRKTVKFVSQNDDLIFASLINFHTDKLQLIACSNQTDSVTLWSTGLDERALQLNARLLDFVGLSETMTFLGRCINQSDFSLTKDQNQVSQINVTFTNSKNKQSITLHLIEHADENEKALFLSRILFNVYKRNEQLANEIQTQQIRIKELSTKGQSIDNSTNQLFDGNNSKSTNVTKSQERSKMSIINPRAKRRKAATGINYDEDDSD